MNDCVFCKIVDGNISSYKIWEDEDHIAFLSIYPNTEGVTVVIPKRHYPSYVFSLPDDAISNLVLAAKKVALLLDEKLDDVGRTAMVFEGFGVDHVHAKLFPMHGTANSKEWKRIESNVNKFFTEYEGYISSHDFKEASAEELRKVQDKVRNRK